MSTGACDQTDTATRDRVFYLPAEAVDFHEALGEVAVPEPSDTDEAATPRVVSGYAARVKHVGKMLSELSLLPFEAVDEDSVRSTDWAIDRTSKILQDACKAFLFHPRRPLPLEFPAGYLASDGDGGVRIEWGKPGDRSVRLAIASSKERRSYLYFERGNSTGIRPPSGIALAKTLREILE
jgi:hypothetical protein